MFVPDHHDISSPGAHDDEPPPLEDMSEFIATKFRSDHNHNLPPPLLQPPPRKTVDAVTLRQQPDAKLLAEPFKKGFLNSKPTGKTNLQKRRNDGHKSATPSDDMPFLKAKDPRAANIPDIFKVKLEDSPRDVLRKELTDMLEPTKDIVNEVMDNEIIKTGLGDPEILFAVQEIAGDPDAIERHRHNPKVVNFYSQLGKLMGSKLQLREKEGKQ